MPLGFTLSGKPYHETVTLTTTPKTLRELIGPNKLGPKGKIELGVKLVEISGDILWGETANNCDIPFAAADEPWDEPIAPGLDLFFKAASGTETVTVIAYRS